MTPTFALLDGYMQLFRGRRDRYGTGKGWNKGLEFPSTAAEETTWRGAYAAHLDGQGSGLGIFPHLDDGTVWFAAIDLDEPDFETARAMQAFVPGSTWIERSRSGNAHVWAFFREPIEAWIARAVLRNATEAMNKPRVEIFPKQDRLMEGMVGNFINLPYHGEERPILNGDDPVISRAVPLPVGFFVDSAMSQRTDPDMWRRRALSLGAKDPADRAPSAAFGSAPKLHRCAEYMMERGPDGEPLRYAEEGQRHQAVFVLARMLLNYRDLPASAARSMVDIYNADFVRPPIDEREIDRMFRNIPAHGYTSTGCDDPLVEGLVDPQCPIARGDFQ